MIIEYVHRSLRGSEGATLRNNDLVPAPPFAFSPLLPTLQGQ